MNQDHVFWDRVLQLAKDNLKQSAFDFFVADARLIGINGNTATIFLDSPFKKLFWEEKEAVRRNIIEELPGAAGFFTGPEDPDMAIYKLEVTNVIFRSLENVARAELHFRK